MPAPRRARTRLSCGLAATAVAAGLAAAPLASVTGPTPWKRLTGSPRTKAGPRAGVTTHRPSGLFWSEANLARNLL